MKTLPNPPWQGMNPNLLDQNVGVVGIVEGKGLAPSVIFLEIVLTQNWLIFTSQAGSRPFWSPMPSSQLIVAIFLVDVLVTAFCVLGWFNGGGKTVSTSPLTIVRMWVFSLGVFCVMAGIYHLFVDSPVYYRLLHFKSQFRRSRERRNLEDFGKSPFGLGFPEGILIRRYSLHASTDVEPAMMKRFRKVFIGTSDAFGLGS